MKKQLNYLPSLVEHFQRRWKHEYLIDLRKHQRCNNELPVRQAKIGDIVLIEEELTPRCRWRMDKVEELICSQDCYVRGCK